MATTKVDIANLALLRVGQSGTVLTALSDGTPSGDAMGRLFDLTAGLVLKALPWPFATRTVRMQQNTLVTDPEWRCAYTLPPDLLHPLGLVNEYGYMQVPYLISGPVMLTNYYSGTDGAYLRYVRSDALDPATVDPWPEYVDAVAWRLAAEYAPAVIGKGDIVSAMVGQYNAAMKAARKAIGFTRRGGLGLSNQFAQARITGVSGGTAACNLSR